MRPSRQQSCRRTTIIRNVSFDAADPGALARWWAQVFDSGVAFDDGDDAAFDLPSGQTVYFQRVPEGKADEPRTDPGSTRRL
ncbi:VOC family protein [Catellatospora sichuanensis]|uniref:VOC family protein n=1 Tax=Catellatospora sichuanensis TaxID=1969805 RepID=UPI001FE5A870|nr:VOC family protein [Catellatospora sichuanensis]